MPSLLAILIGGLLLVSAGSARGQKPEADGDALPTGALARLGSLRLRHPDTVCTIAFAPDGKTPFAAGADKIVRQWDVGRGKELRSLPGLDEEVRGLALVADGKRMVCVGLVKSGWARNLNDDKDDVTIEGHEDCIEGLACSPDGTVLATAGRDHLVGLWKTDSGDRIRWLKGHANGVGCVAFSPDGRTLASGGWDGSVRLWDTATGKELKTLTAPSVDAVAFSPDGKLLAYGGKDDTIHVWDVAAGKANAKIRTGLERIWSLTFGRDSKVLLVGGDGKRDNLFAFDPTTGKELWKRPAHGTGRAAPATNDFRTPFRGTSCVVVAPDGRSVATGGADGRIRLWDVASGRDLLKENGHQDAVVGLDFADDGRSILTGTIDGVLRRHDVPTGKERRRNAVAGIVALVSSRSAGRAALLSADGSLEIQAHDGRKINAWKAAAVTERCLALSPSGRVVATGEVRGRTTTLVLWDVATGKELRRLHGLEEDVLHVVFSPDDKTVAAVGKDDVIRFWESESGKPKVVLSDRLRGATRPAWSDDGSIFAAGFDGSRSVVVWDAATGKPLVECAEDGSAVVALAISPDNQTLFSAHADGMLRYWEVGTGKERRSLRPHAAPMTALSLSPDGRILATASVDQTALLWNRWATSDAIVDRPTSPRLQELWTDLASDDAGRAYSAMCVLIASGDAGLTFLRPRVLPIAKLDEERLARWVADLDARSFKAREEAMDNLARLGRPIEGRLRTALAGKLSLDAKRRIEDLLKRMEGTGPVQEWRRMSRAVEVLEQNGGPAARELLKKVAEGGEVEPTLRARAALRRLERNQSKR